MDIKKRCEDCANLKIVKGVWTCEECFGQHCEDIDDCPDGITPESVEAMELSKAEQKAVKRMLGNAKSEKVLNDGIEKKPRTVKENVEKIKIIDIIANVLEQNAGFLVEITNKQREIHLRIGENDYKVTLTATRKPKNS